MKMGENASEELLASLREEIYEMSYWGYQKYPRRIGHEEKTRIAEDEAEKFVEFAKKYWNAFRQNSKDPGHFAVLSWIIYFTHYHVMGEDERSSLDWALKSALRSESNMEIMQKAREARH